MSITIPSIDSFVDLELESMVLNALMVLNGSDRDLALIALREEYFYEKHHKNIYKTILDLESRGYETSIEIVFAELKTVFAEAVDSFKAIVSGEVIPNPTFGVEKLKEWHGKRILYNAALQTIDKLANSESARDIASTVIKEADRVLLEGDSDTKSFAQLEEEYKDAKPVPIYQTDIAFFDQRNKGLRAGELVAVMGDPDAGKTSLVIQMLRNVTKKGHRAMFFPLEFSSRDMVEKNKWRKDFNKDLLLLEDRFTSIYDIEAEIKKQAIKGTKIFAIDSQMVVNVPGNFDNGSVREAEKFRVLQRLAIAYEIVILFVCQQSNAHSNGGVILPMGSKHAGHFVHSIWYIKKPKLEFNRDGEDKNAGLREFMQTKSKSGGGYFKVNIELNPKTLDFKGVRPKKSGASYEVIYEDSNGKKESISVPSMPLID